MLWQSLSALFYLVACQTAVVVESFVTGGGGLLSPSSRTVTRTQRFAAEDTQQATDAAVNGENNSGLILQADAKSQLFASFAALSLADQYDAVLTGLCAKILDSPDATEQAAITALQDPLQLMQEMNDQRIPASARSLMALIDSAVKTQDATTMARAISLGRRNSGILEYGSRQADVMDLPSTPTTRVKCPDGQTKTRAERLTAVRGVPKDDRATEVSSALAVAGLAGGCELTNLAGMDDIAPGANFLLSLIVTVGLLDNFYDIIKSASTFAVQQTGNEKIKGFDLPDKDSLPLGLGSGQVTGQVVRGLTRLVTIDPRREALCEAAALFTAYSLGLPCFAFRSNALEASVLAVESRDSEDLDSLLSSNGIMRLLVWLMAPVAAESAQFPVCIMSDPREAEGFLERLESVAENSPPVAAELWWLNDATEREDLLKWAYTEADLLIRTNRKVVDRLAERLEGGAATVGDCVALLERW